MWWASWGPHRGDSFGQPRGPGQVGEAVSQNEEGIGPAVPKEVGPGSEECLPKLADAPVRMGLEDTGHGPGEERRGQGGS